MIPTILVISRIFWFKVTMLCDIAVWELRIASMPPTKLRKASRPSVAAESVSSAMPLTSVALSAICEEVRESSSMDASTSVTDAACCTVALSWNLELSRIT